MSRTRIYFSKVTKDKKSCIQNKTILSDHTYAEIKKVIVLALFACAEEKNPMHITAQLSAAALKIFEIKANTKLSDAKDHLLINLCVSLLLTAFPIVIEK